jgi:HPt (histidine-containing phosphotransfer) domain-containing protein
MVVPVELKQKYLSRRIQDLIRLKEALAENDFAPALKLGHQVKGNAVTFEFPHMTPIGVEMELAARTQDKERIMSLVQKMESAIFSAQSIFA